MNPELKNAIAPIIEKEIGIKIDGQITTGEALAVYKFLFEVAESFCPALKDKIDAKIDGLEAIAMTRSKWRKELGLASCKAVRLALQCPDDDNNIEQK